MSDTKEYVENRMLMEFDRLSFAEFTSQGIQMSFDDFRRQCRVLAALSNGSAAVPKASNETQINVDRVSKAIAHEKLKEAEKKAQIELGTWSENESTMVFGSGNKNPSLEATYENLAKRYASLITLEDQKSEIEAFLHDKTIALRSFQRYWDIDYSHKRWIAFWWMAAKDANQNICKVSAVEDRLARFVYALEDTLRAGNRNNKYGMDNGSAEDKLACGHGFFNKFCEAFFGYHPDDVFVGLINPKMAQMTKNAALTVFIHHTLKGDRKELYEAIQACQDCEANRAQREMIDRFLNDVYKVLDLEIKREFGDHEKLFKPLLQEFAPTAEWVKFPTPEEAEKIHFSIVQKRIPALTPQEIKALSLEQIKTLEALFETLTERYQCPMDLRFPKNPIRIQRHPGIALLLQVFENEHLQVLNNCPLSSRKLNLGQKLFVLNPISSDELKGRLEKYGEHGPLVCAKKEIIFFAVAANDCLQKAALLIEILDKTYDVESFRKLNREIEDLLKKPETLALRSNAEAILQKLHNGKRGEVSELELSSADIDFLQPLWSFKLDPRLGLSQIEKKCNADKVPNAASMVPIFDHSPGQRLNPELRIIFSSSRGDILLTPRGGFPVSAMQLRDLQENRQLQVNGSPLQAQVPNAGMPVPVAAGPAVPPLVQIPVNPVPVAQPPAPVVPTPAAAPVQNAFRSRRF